MCSVINLDMCRDDTVINHHDVINDICLLILKNFCD